MFIWNEGDLNSEQAAAIGESGSVFLIACPGSGRPEYKGVKEQQTFDQMLQSAWTAESPDAFGAVAEQFSSVNVSLKERAKNIVKAARGRPTSRDTPDVPT